MRSSKPTTIGLAEQLQNRLIVTALYTSDRKNAPGKKNGQITTEISHGP